MFVTPGAAELLVCSVSVLATVVEFGVNVAVTPAGRLVALRVTEPVKPPRGTTDTVALAAPPWTVVRGLGETIRE
jgi:hypothetical protein